MPTLSSAGAAAVRAEIAGSVRLAIPVVAAQVGMVLMGTVDTAMLGHCSAEALAAGAIGTILSFTLLMLGSGTLWALDPLVSQAHGAGDPRAVAAHFERGLVLAAILAVPVSLGMADIEPLLRLLGEPPGVTAGAALFTRTLIWGNLPFLLFVVCRQTLQGMSDVRPAIVAIVIGNLVNAAADYVLIFGHFGLPALGVAGSAYATAGARWVMFLCLLVATRRKLAAVWRRFTRGSASLKYHLQLLRIGLPIGLHQSVELGFLLIVALLVGRLGIAPLAGHQIALNLASISFMVPLGISGAATTRTGNAIGRGDMPAARRTAAVCLVLGAGVMTLFAAAFALAPVPLARIYTADPVVAAAAAALLPIAAMFQVFDGIQVVAAGILRSSADTALPATAALVGYLAIGLPVGWLFAFPRHHGAAGLWWGITLGLALVAILLLARIAHRFRGNISNLAAT
jgi:MATE family multidrug resistance protein